MFASLIEASILNMGAKTITEVAIWIMVIIFFVSLGLKMADRATRLTQYTPTLLTSIGIFGTFCGIVAGLLGFEITDIDGSIGELLAGMKTAFITSLVGMALSIVFKLFVSGWKKPKGYKATNNSLGVKDLYEAMREQNENLQQLTRAIGGDNDSSLVSQIKLFKSDSNDNHRTHMQSMQAQQEMFEKFQQQLRVQLEEFAEMLSKSATETVIDALKQVITEFNEKLTEQFGENFKQLNSAVLELVAWQENYKQQLGEMQVQYAHGVSAISETEAAIANISEHTGAIPASMQGLQQIISTNQHQVEELSRHLEAFKDMRDKAVEAVPQIQKQISATLTGIKTGSEQLVSGITESSTKLNTVMMQSAEDLVDGSKQVHVSLQSTSDALLQDSSLTTQMWKDTVRDLGKDLGLLTEDIAGESKKITTHLRESGEAILEETRRNQKTFESGLDEVRTHLNRTVEAVASKQDEEMQRVFAGLRQQMEKTVGDTGETVSKQVGFLDKALEKEINNTMNELGRALTSITQQFTHDYTDLVNAMKAITHR